MLVQFIILKMLKIIIGDGACSGILKGRSFLNEYGEI